MFSRVLAFIHLGASYSQAESREIYSNRRRTLKTQTNQSQSLKTALQEDFETKIGVNNICVLPTETIV